MGVSPLAPVEAKWPDGHVWRIPWLTYEAFMASRAAEAAADKNNTLGKLPQRH